MGAEVARAVSGFGGSVSSARVVPLSAMSQMEPESDRIRIALNFAREHLAEALPVERSRRGRKFEFAAVRARISPGNRRNTGEGGRALRVEAARLRLQGGSEPIEQIALAVGFTDPERMRRAFIKLHGHPPQAIRRESRSNGAR